MPKAVAHLWLPGFCSRAEAVLREHLKEAALVVVRSRQVMDASRSAKMKGIELGMSLRQARLTCPDLVEVAYVPERYAELADRLWRICANYSPAVEPRAQHEAFIDLAGCSDASGTLDRISRDIQDILGIRPAFGIADCKLVARIASGILAQARPGSREKMPEVSCDRQVSRLEKHDETLSARPARKLAGGVVVTGRARNFLSPMPVSVLWTLDEDTISRLLRLGVRTVGEVQGMARSELADMFGQEGYVIHECSLGIDRSSVLPIYPKKTVVFRKAFDGEAAHEAVLVQAVNDGASFIERELNARAVAARKWGLLLELVHADQVVCEKRLAKPSDFHGGARAVYRNLLKEALAQPKLRGPVEAVSLMATDLVPAMTASQVDMFDPYVATDSARVVDAVVGRVREKFGAKSLFPASLLECDRRDEILLAWEACYEKGKQVASGCGARRSASEEVLLETEMASCDFCY